MTSIPGSDFVRLVDQKPIMIEEVQPGVFLVDFGKVAFGNIAIKSSQGSTQNITVHFGESLVDGRINRKPPGTVRYSSIRADLKPGENQVIAPPADPRNTQAETKAHPPAILTPKNWGTLVPFRWVEIEGWSGAFGAEQIKRRAAFAKTWDDNASFFQCSDPMLNQVWDLSRYSIKATTFAGIFVDGDRERIPYEADAYLNQLSYYTTSSDIQMPRLTFDHLMDHGTWPTEWSYHMIFMAYADWMRTGDRSWLASRYDFLKTKLLLERVGTDGLVHSSAENISKSDIVDWPANERDGYEFSSLNTVVNSFYIRCLRIMSILGKELGRDSDSSHFSEIEKTARTSFQAAFFDSQVGLYLDGATNNHHSLHANLFPLAFDLTPEASRKGIATWLVTRGMRCSVYAAQYFLEGLFETGFDREALDLITAPGDRSWRHMVNSGTTITWEAWDQKYKPNQDWNHAWGAAPANLLPRYVLGIRPLVPGWKKVSIAPHIGSLTFARGTVPTPNGPIHIDWKRSKTFILTLKLPRGLSSAVELPVLPNLNKVYVNGKLTEGTIRGGRLNLDREYMGAIKVELR